MEIMNWHFKTVNHNAELIFADSTDHNATKNE